MRHNTRDNRISPEEFEDLQRNEDREEDVRPEQSEEDLDTPSQDSEVGEISEDTPMGSVLEDEQVEEKTGEGDEDPEIIITTYNDPGDRDM